MAYRISIHSLRGEGDHNRKKRPESGEHFNPLPPWGGRRVDLSGFEATAEISIHSLRGEGDVLATIDVWQMPISIHSLRGEGDGMSWVRSGHWSTISIHSLRGEGDVISCAVDVLKTYISIHSLRGEGDSIEPALYSSYH